MSKELKDQIHNVLLERDESGETLISREVARHIDVKANDIIKAITFRFGIALAGIVVSAASSWFALYYQVQDNTEKISQGGTGVSRSELDVRFSNIDAQILQLRTDLNSDVTEIKSDVKEIRNILINQ